MCKQAPEDLLDLVEKTADQAEPAETAQIYLRLQHLLLRKGFRHWNTGFRLPSSTPCGVQKLVAALH